MKKLLLSLLCAFTALCMNAVTVVDIYKDFTTTQNINWGSDAANARISYSNTDGLIYSSTEATADNTDAQYWVANGNAFAPENTYKVTMLIKGSVPGVIGNVVLGDWGHRVDNYGKFNIPTGEFQEVSIDVTGATGGDGIMLQTGSYVGDLCIKWVKITHEDSRDASKLYLELTDIPAGTNDWDHQLQYPFDEPIPAGSYTLSLDVKGDAAGSMSIWGDYVEGVGDNNDKGNYGPGFEFGTTWQTKNVDFTLTREYKQFALVFGKYTGSSISFDNITIKNKTTGDVVVSADFSSATLEGFKVAGFLTNDGGWVEHKANYQIVEPTSVTVTIDEALTYSSNKILDFSEVTEAEAYIATACDGEKVTMTKVTRAVPANTGLVIVGNGSVEIPFAATATENVSANKLVATTEATNVPVGSYVLAGTGANLGWYSIGANPANLAAGKAYLTVPAGAKKQLQMVWGEDVTAANAVEAQTTEDGAWYTIAGVKVAAPTVSGLYIHNGKKVNVTK